MENVDALDPLYRQNHAYRAEYNGTFWILSDAAGWGVACDPAVQCMWAVFDGRPTPQVTADLGQRYGFSAALVESTAKVLARAGLLLPSQALPSIAHVPGLDWPQQPQRQQLPLVSILILASRQARPHLETCLPSVAAQTYPNLEIILIDNQTSDDSAAFTRQHFPQVKVLTISSPMGFGAANNFAMKQAQGEFFFLVNEDTEMEPDCIAECVRVMARSSRVAVVAAKMRLFYMRAFFNSMGNSTHPDGACYDNFIGYLDVGQFDSVDQVFTACFGAAMLRRSVVDRIGYMDERYFIYYDDIDWSLRARMAGYEVAAAPRAIVYHKFNATVDTFGSTFKLDLTIRNRLRFAWKNFDLARARRFARHYQMEDDARVVWAKDRGLSEIVETYRASRRRWLLSLPEVAIARWQTRRLRQPAYDEAAALALANAVPPLMMYGKYPILSTDLIRAHYMQLDRFKPQSPLAPEDRWTALGCGPGGAPAADLALGPDVSLGQKAWRALRQKGPGGLAQETYAYLRWLVRSR